MPVQPRDAAHVRLLVRQDERHARARAPRAARPADSVRVRLPVLRGVEVDHVRHVVEVEPARGHVGGDQRRDATALEPLERPLALALVEVAVHGDRLDAALVELAREPVGAALCADEDEREAAFRLEQLDQRVDLGVRRHGHEAMLDLARRVLGRQLRLDPCGGVRVRARQLADLAVERRGEEHRLPVAREPLHDPVDLRLEPHVEHAVGLVEDEDLDGVERDQPAVDQVLQAAGRRDDDVRVTGGVGLRANRDAAVDGRDREVAGGGEELDLLCHLEGELARGNEDERGGARVVVRHPLDERNREGEGLARARRRLGEQVGARERRRNGAGLDLERRLDAARTKRLGELRAHAERGERLLEHVTPVFDESGSRPTTFEPTRSRTRRISRADPMSTVDATVAAGSVGPPR